MASQLQTGQDTRTAMRTDFLNSEQNCANSTSANYREKNALICAIKAGQTTSSDIRHQQNFSSRNSLRTSQSFANTFNAAKHKNITLKMPNYKECNVNHKRFEQDPGADSDNYLCSQHIGRYQDYTPLASECFIKQDGHDVICILCNRREKYRNERTFLSHLASEQHNLLYNELRFSLSDLTPDADSIQMRSNEEILCRWYNGNHLKPEDISLRLQVVNEFEYILKLVDPSCESRLIGSLMSGTSLKSSDVDLELVHPNSVIFLDDPRAKKSIHHRLLDPDADFGYQINLHTHKYDLIPNAVDTLHKIMKFINDTKFASIGSIFTIKSNHGDLMSKVPKLTLTHINTNIKLDVNCYSESCYKQAILLNTYLSLDTRARVLSVLIKYWAKLCRIDDPGKGTFPPDSFIILVIYYLQRVNPPVLPCLHEIVIPQFKGKEDSSFDLLDKLHINSDQSIPPPDTSSREAERSQNQLDDLLDKVDEELDGEEDDIYFELDQKEIKDLNWVSKNETPINVLFIDFLKSMMKEFDNIFNVITIRTLQRVTLANKDWTTQVKAIENPVKPKVNISRCIGTVRTFEFIKRCFRHGYYYLTSLPLDSKLRAKNDLQTDPRDFVELYVNNIQLNKYYWERRNNLTSSSWDIVRHLISHKIFARDIKTIASLLARYNKDKHPSRTMENVLPKTIANFYNEDLLVPKDILATTFCWLCRKNGHYRSTCPKMNLENLFVESRTYDFELDEKANFDDCLTHLYTEDVITQHRAAEHESILADIAKIINDNTDLNCQLQLFGSTVNDLGSQDSDLDICMTLKDNPTGRGVDCVQVLQKAHKVLENVKEASSIEPILTARVPIIRFKYRGSDIDLSMYNQCAIYNSKLLKTYSSFDPRVSKLFYLVKRFAKVRIMTALTFT